MRNLVAPLTIFASIALLAGPARAGDWDLDEEDPKTAPPPPAAPRTSDSVFGEAPPTAVKVRKRTYDLAECLALADRNHPNLWVMRSRVAFAHAQLDEAKWVPFWQFGAQAGVGVIGTQGGTAYYGNSPRIDRLTQISGSIQPLFQFSIGGTLPLYTFGKISAAKEAAEAQVRVNEWDIERVRQLVRMDVRRAYYGLQLARDSRYLLEELSEKLEKNLTTLRKKLASGDKSVDEVDRIRLENSQDDLTLKKGLAQRGETFATATLRFFTGIQSEFDIPDEPLKRPDVTIGPVVQYLAAARLMRPEINQARAGIAARRALVDLQRARLFPDLGLGLNAGYNVAPSIVRQPNAWNADPFNSFGFGFGVGMRWNLDLLPQSARVRQAESQLEETRAQLRLALGGIAVEVENQYGTVLEAKTREETWGRLEHRSKGWLSLTQDRIDLGTYDERALGEPIAVYFNARSQHMIALMDLNIALSELARVTGWDGAAPPDR